MKLNELLAWFDQGGQFGDDPEIVACMRRYIQANRRLLFEMNNLWHEDENEIPIERLFDTITFCTLKGRFCTLQGALLIDS